MHDSPPIASRRIAALSSTLAVSVALAAFGAAPAFADTPAPVAIDVVTTNDFHGRLEAANPAAGAAVLGGMVRSYEAANPNTLFVGAGDLIGASTFTSFIQQDTPTIEALNAIGLDASALGNHEFDQGTDDLDNRVIPTADWPYLSANVYKKGTQTAAYQEYEIRQFGDVSIGFIGAVTEELPSLVSPAGIATLDVGPVVPAVNRVADQLSDGVESNGEADVLMLLVHEGATTSDISSSTDDSVFGKIVSGTNANVDAIISAHTHLPYNHLIPVAGSSKIRPVMSSGQYGERFGHLALTVDPTTGELLTLTSEVKPLFGAFAPQADVAKIVADAVDVAKVKGSVKVGEITADFNRARQVDGTTENRGGESSIGNFVADVQLWATQSADTEIALMNPGGLRSDLKFAANSATPGDGQGIVTFQEAAGVQPFANTLVAMDLTTSQLKAVLEQQWQPSTSSRPFLKLGVSKSLEYTYDPAGLAGDRIDAIYVNGKIAGDGDVFRVAVNSFLTSGGDNFTVLAEGTNRADTGKIDLQSQVDYFQAFPVATPDFEQRSVGANITPVDTDGYGAGDQVTLNLSSLLFSGSGNGPSAGTATVTLGTTVLGSSPIDPTTFNANDEVGRASVTFTVPSGVYGPQVLTVSVAENGTSIDVPVLFAEQVIVPITNVTAPTISGMPRAGSTLATDGGTWSIDDPTLTYQWKRNGLQIKGATKSTYVLVPADAGQRVSVTVTASGEGSTPASKTSTPKTVYKLSSTTTGVLSRTTVTGSQTTTYKVTVGTSVGTTPTGTVRVFDGTKQIASGTLSSGVVTFTLPKLSVGTHYIQAKYAGTSTVYDSNSVKSKLIVK